MSDGALIVLLTIVFAVAMFIIMMFLWMLSHVPML